MKLFTFLPLPSASWVMIFLISCTVAASFRDSLISLLITSSCFTVASSLSLEILSLSNWGALIKLL